MTKNYYTFSGGKIAFTLLMLCMLFSVQTGWGQVTLGASPYTQNFNSIGSGLPTGWTVRTGATASALGTTQTLVTAATSWGTTTGQFNNAASGNSPSASGDVAGTQSARTDRALAVRQASSFGDPGAAFVLQINNTTGLTNFNLAFKLMQLDPGTAARTATWNVDYGFGATPTTFTNATTSPATLTTTVGTWTTTSVTINFGSALDNNAGPVWIRVATKAATTGSGTRPVTAIDDYSLSYSAAATPTLTVSSTSPSFGNVCLNTQSSESSFTVSGSNLTAGAIAVGPLANYQFSLSAGGGGGYTSSVSIPNSGGTLTSTNVYVVFTPTAVQSYNGNVTVAGGGDSKTSAVTGSGVNTAPSVTSGSASGITQTTATVAGTIPSIGCSGLSTYGIEYSTTASFPNGTGTAVSSTNLSGINFSSALSGLTLNTVYYYHAYATNSGGTAYGVQGTFTTASISAPVATAASNVSYFNFDANWNASTGATGYFLDVSTYSNFIDPSNTNLVEFSFPSNPDDANADGGTGANGSATMNAVGGQGTVTYAPVQSSTTSAASCNTWDNGNGTKYWQTEINTVNYYNLTVSSKQRSSGTGPRDFKLQYKIGAGGTYTDVTGGTVTTANNWTAGVLNNLALPAACENQSSVFLRWIMTSNNQVTSGTVAAAGTSGIDEVFVNGNAGSYVTVYENLSVGNVLTYPVTGLSSNTTYYYRVRATNGLVTSGNSNTINLTTLVCNLPSITSVSSNSPICVTSNLNLTSSVTGTTPFTYQWSGSGTFNDNTLANPSVTGASTGNYTVTVTNVCGNSTSSTAVTVVSGVPAQPGAISGAPVGVCPPSAPFTLSISAVAGASSYYWYAPSGTSGVNFLTATNGLSVNVEYVATPNSTYKVRVEAVNACGNSAYSSALTRRSVSTPATVSGAVFACPSETKSYTASAVTGADGYVWTGPTGTLFDGSNPTPYTTASNTVNATFAPGFTGGSICVAATVSCFTSSQKCITVGSTGTSQPGALSGLLSVCPGQQNVPYSVPNVSGVTYTWTAPANASIDLGQGTNSVTVDYDANFVSGDISVVANTACGASPVRRKTITASSGGTTLGRPDSISGVKDALCGTTQTYTAYPNVAGATYNWTFPSGTTINSQAGNTINVTFPSTLGNTSISVYPQFGCVTGLVRSVPVKGSPSTLAVSGNGSVCANTGGYNYSVPSRAGVSYLWAVPAGAVITAGAGTDQITVTFGSSPGQVSCYQYNACGGGSAKVLVAITCRTSAASNLTADEVEFNAYPNPASEALTIEWNASKQGRTTLMLTDLSGKAVFTENVVSLEGKNSNTIDVSSLAKGMYLLNVTTTQGNVQTKIVVE